MAENNMERGFGAMNEEEQREISRKGGEASGGGRSEGGRSSESNSSNRGLASADRETRQRVASEGGKSVSRNSEHMRAIGRKGGENSRGGGRKSNNS
jgi:uncharacterized protein